MGTVLTWDPGLVEMRGVLCVCAKLVCTRVCMSARLFGRQVGDGVLQVCVCKCGWGERCALLRQGPSR